MGIKDEQNGKKLAKVLLTSAVIIALTTATLPYITGYGTNLFQIIVLGAWGIVAHFSSGLFADRHHGLVWPVALPLNIVAFLAIAVPIWLVFRNRAPRSLPWRLSVSYCSTSACCISYSPPPMDLDAACLDLSARLIGHSRWQSSYHHLLPQLRWQAACGLP